jgi:hypothetical protein
MKLLQNIMTTWKVGETLQHIRKIVSRLCSFEVSYVRIYGYMIRIAIVVGHN